MELIDHRIVGLIKTTVNWLVSGDYTAIERRSRGVRLKADDLREAVETYGRTLRALPESAYPEIDAIKVNRAGPPTWSITVPLWSEEEGRSDLTLECSVIDRGVQELDIEIDNLHVL